MSKLRNITLNKLECVQSNQYIFVDVGVKTVLVYLAHLARALTTALILHKEANILPSPQIK